MERYKNQESDRRDNDRNQSNQSSTTDELEHNWRDMEHSYRQQYPNITDEDVNYQNGEFDTLTERVARRTNRTRKDIENDIRNWKNNRDRQ